MEGKGNSKRIEKSKEEKENCFGMCLFDKIRSSLEPEKLPSKYEVVKTVYWPISERGQTVTVKRISRLEEQCETYIDLESDGLLPPIKRSPSPTRPAVCKFLPRGPLVDITNDGRIMRENGPEVKTPECSFPYLKLHKTENLVAEAPPKLERNGTEEKSEFSSDILQGSSSPIHEEVKLHKTENLVAEAPPKLERNGTEEKSELSSDILQGSSSLKREEVKTNLVPKPKAKRSRKSSHPCRIFYINGKPDEVDQVKFVLDHYGVDDKPSINPDKILQGSNSPKREKVKAEPKAKRSRKSPNPRRIFNIDSEPIEVNQAKSVLEHDEVDDKPVINTDKVDFNLDREDLGPKPESFQ